MKQKKKKSVKKKIFAIMTTNVIICWLNSINIIKFTIKIIKKNESN